jgi:hypothetical protein
MPTIHPDRERREVGTVVVNSKRCRVDVSHAREVGECGAVLKRKRETQLEHRVDGDLEVPEHCAKSEVAPQPKRSPVSTLWLLNTLFALISPTVCT